MKVNPVTDTKDTTREGKISNGVNHVRNKTPEASVLLLMRVSNGVKFFILLVIPLLFTGAVYAVQDLPIFFNYPSFKGDFYVSGRVPFPPGAVKSEENITIKSREPEEEIPAKITVLRRWADGSLLSAEIVFVANVDRKRDYVLSYADEIHRRKVFTETAVLPTISFSVGGAPKISERVDIDVGAINVRVDKSHDIYYYWYIIPIVILIAVLYYRSKRTKKI